jgi:pimeloyl-ACP methyl ester carboxylesterase
LSEELIILPGLMCDSAMFAEALRVIPDARSVDDHYGGADDIGRMAARVLADAPPRFALIGHSMGARVALELYARAPERVSRLMLADTGVHGVAEGEADKRHALRDLGRREGFEALVDAWLPPMVAAADPELMDQLRTMCLRAGQTVFEAQTAALLNRPDAARVLGHIACPLSVVVGEADHWSPVAQHEAIAARVPGARLHIIPGAGHFAPAERPGDFIQIVQDWLAQPAAQPQAKGAS